MVLNGESGLECEIRVNGMQLKHMSEFKYLGCILEESGTDQADCRRESVSRRMVGRVLLGL